jgi:AcrR family transcriptional regulator
MATQAKLRGNDRGLVGYAGGGRQPPLPIPPTQARGAEKRDRLYEAAIARYQRAGVANTKVEDVIADAGVSWATFFRYFPRKEDVLIEGAARHFRAHVRQESERALRDRRLRIRTVIKRTFAALLEPGELPPDLHTAAVLEVFSNPARFAALVGDHPQPVVGLVADLMGEGQRRTEVRADIDPGLAALVLTAGCMLPAAQAAAAGADPLVGASAALDVLWKGFGDPGTQQRH